MRIAVIKKTKLNDLFSSCIKKGYKVYKNALHIEIEFSKHETGYCDLKEYDSNHYEILCHASSNSDPDVQGLITLTGDIINEIINNIEKHQG